MSLASQISSLASRIAAEIKAVRSEVASTYAPKTRQVTAGTGLTGGGDLSADRTLALANTGVSAGSYAYATLTVDAQGRITAASANSAPSNGVDGKTILSGSGVPSSGLGSNGDYYLDQNSTVYDLTSANWSISASPIGQTSGSFTINFPNNPGSSGVNLYDGNGVAIASAGFNPAGTSYVYNWTSSNGNPVRRFEIRQSTTNRIIGAWEARLYGPKTAGAWGVGTPLRGPQGSSGVVAATSPITYNSSTQTVGINQAQLSITMQQVNNMPHPFLLMGA